MSREELNNNTEDNGKLLWWPRTEEIFKVLKWQQKTRKSFATIKPEAELNLLKKWEVPAELLYVGKAGERLHEIDQNLMHPYTALVNSQFLMMFIGYWSELGYYHKKLWECLSNMDKRIDIGTGNGQVSNAIALNLVNQISLKRWQDVTKAYDWMKNWNQDSIQKYLEMLLNPVNQEKPEFVSCDFSKESLWIAEDYAHNKFYDLEKFYKLSYFPGRFQDYLAWEKSNNGGNRLLTMFNVLANFELESLKDILKEAYNVMKPGDVLLPSIFLKTEENSPKRMEYLIKTQMLYNNPETRDRCVKSFAERYNIPEELIDFHVSIKNDGREYVSIDISIPTDQTINIPDMEGELELSTKNIEWQKSSDEKRVLINLFKSYRMSMEEFRSICEEIGFSFDEFSRNDRIRDQGGLMAIPVLYKE